MAEERRKEEEQRSARQAAARERLAAREAAEKAKRAEVETAQRARAKREAEAKAKREAEEKEKAKKAAEREKVVAAASAAAGVAASRAASEKAQLSGTISVGVGAKAIKAEPLARRGRQRASSSDPSLPDLGDGTAAPSALPADGLLLPGGAAAKPEHVAAQLEAMVADRPRIPSNQLPAPHLPAIQLPSAHLPTPALPAHSLPGVHHHLPGAKLPGAQLPGAHLPHLNGDSPASLPLPVPKPQLPLPLPGGAGVMTAPAGLPPPPVPGAGSASYGLLSGLGAAEQPPAVQSWNQHWPGRSGARGNGSLTQRGSPGLPPVMGGGGMGGSSMDVVGSAGGGIGGSGGSGIGAGGIGGGGIGGGGMGGGGIGGSGAQQPLSSASTPNMSMHSRGAVPPAMGLGGSGLLGGLPPIAPAMSNAHPTAHSTPHSGAHPNVPMSDFASSLEERGFGGVFATGPPSSLPPLHGPLWTPNGQSPSVGPMSNGLSGAQLTAAAPGAQSMGPSVGSVGSSIGSGVIGRKADSGGGARPNQHVLF